MVLLACGVSTGVKAEPLIINGVRTNRTSVPWHASLFIRINDSAWTYLCGGSIIRNQVILTAAHCIAWNHERVNDPKNFRVVLGAVSSNYNQNTPASGAKIHSVSLSLELKQGYNCSRRYARI